MTQSVELDFQPIRNVPAYPTVARLIEGKIMRGEWAVGHGLPSETALAEHLGVNARPCAKRSGSWRRSACCAVAGAASNSW